MGRPTVVELARRKLAWRALNGEADEPELREAWSHVTTALRALPPRSRHVVAEVLRAGRPPRLALSLAWLLDGRQAPDNARLFPARAQGEPRQVDIDELVG